MRVRQERKRIVKLIDPGGVRMDGSRGWLAQKFSALAGWSHLSLSLVVLKGLSTFSFFFIISTSHYKGLQVDCEKEWLSCLSRVCHVVLPCHDVKMKARESEAGTRSERERGVWETCRAPLLSIEWGKMLTEENISDVMIYLKGERKRK